MTNTTTLVTSAGDTAIAIGVTDALKVAEVATAAEIPTALLPIFLPLEAGLASKLEEFLCAELPGLIGDIEHEAENFGSKIVAFFKKLI